MDAKIKAENEALKQLFEHPGWQVLLRNTKAQLDAFRDGFPFNVNTIEQLYFCRGMTAALQSLLSLEDSFEAQEQAALEESDADTV
jgi:hypothetical protein